MIPNIIKNDIFWEGNVQLTEWNRYFEYDLNIKLNIGGETIINKITNIHENGYKYLHEKQSEILETAINEIYNSYSDWQEEYGYEGVEKQKLMPNLLCSDNLKKLVTPIKVYILDIENDNMPYLGIEFVCKWDEDHGVGIMMHKNRIVKIGGANIAFLTWIAEEDKEE
jgi:hypothetical protein